MKPLDMILYCPNCGMQHIDRPNHWSDKFDAPMGGEDPEDRAELDASVAAYEAEWTNPPHKSHLCQGCGCIWRPADVATNGVAELKTTGKDDTWPAIHNEEVRAARGMGVPQAPSITAMVDAAMVEMSNIHPPLRRSECERLIRAAIGVAPSHEAQQFMVSSIQRRAGIVTLELVTMDGAVQPLLETGQRVTLSPLGVPTVQVPDLEQQFMQAIYARKDSAGRRVDLIRIEDAVRIARAAAGVQGMSPQQKGAQ